MKFLSEIASTHPQAAYSAFTHGMFSRWTFFRTCPISDSHLSLLEDIIHSHFIPALTGQGPPCCVDRKWLALPIRHGGMGLVNPCTFSLHQSMSSASITQPLVNLLLSRSSSISMEVPEETQALKKEIRQAYNREVQNLELSVHEHLTVDCQCLFDIACEKGAFSWLSVLPLCDQSFKGAFRDAVCIQYGWRPSLLPTTCVYDSPFSVEHALSCPYGGFPALWHNELRDTTASLMKEIYHNVCVEPSLQPFSGESFNLNTASRDPGARLDVAWWVLGEPMLEGIFWY